MGKHAGVLALVLLLAACSPVLRREFMDQGAREFDPRHLTETPEVFQGKLFVFGGVIVETRLVEQGSLIEAMFLPVDRYGYPNEDGPYQGRFLALYPRSRGILDPLIYKKGREITIAGEFLEPRSGKIEQMEYTFPMFEIRQVYLWEASDYRWPGYSYYPYYPYPHAYPSLGPWCRDAWGRSYPCPPFWGPFPW